MEEKNKTVHDIKIEIKILEKQVDDIQDQCNHKETLIKYMECDKFRHPLMYLLLEVKNHNLERHLYPT